MENLQIPDFKQTALEIRKNSSPEELKQFIEDLGGSIDLETAVKSVKSAQPEKGLVDKVAAAVVLLGIVKSALDVKHKKVKTGVKNLLGGIAAAGIFGKLVSMKKKPDPKTEELEKRCRLFGKFLCSCEKEEKKKKPARVGTARRVLKRRKAAKASKPAGRLLRFRSK